MDEKKLEDIITRKTNEIIALEKREMEIREAVTDNDYTLKELSDRSRGVRVLPESIAYKLRPLWQAGTKLRIEKKCIEALLKEWKNE